MPNNNVLLWGFGHINKLVLRYLIEKNYNVVGVIGHHYINANAFKIASLEDHPSCQQKIINITHSRDAEKLLETLNSDLKLKPNVCILATRCTVSDIYLTVKILGEYGINTITIAEEPFYSWKTAPALTKEINSLFKKNNVCFTATGVQDVFWGFLPLSIAGSSHKIVKIVGNVQYNVDDYGAALCEAHGVGLSIKAFEESIGNREAPSYIWNSNEWLATKLGKNIKKTTQKISPITVEEPIFSKTLNGEINSGIVTGMKAFVITECDDGLTIETSMVGTVYHGSMIDYCSWDIFGEPNTSVVVNRPSTVEITCATAVNRIQQVINSVNKGYVPTFEFGLIQ
ncbi:uncharacterized protein LOC105846873 [Hydra vulgaris]|uniref:uncharacterized protein LOC105846873 n=1 Tax=Hydra vulgaris TaxID=6087 RepID=UPI0006416F4F|nr:uncharacterized protein LOC105846873 [Hydra vulgaris]